MSGGPKQEQPRVWRTGPQIVGFESQLVAASRRASEHVEIPYPVAKALIEICQQARWVERMREKHPMSQALRGAQDALVAALAVEGQ